MQVQHEVGEVVRAMLAQAAQPAASSEQLRAALSAAATPPPTAALWALPQTELRTRFDAQTARLGEVQEQMAALEAAVPEGKSTELQRRKAAQAEAEQQFAVRHHGSLRSLSDAGSVCGTCARVGILAESAITQVPDRWSEARQ